MLTLLTGACDDLVLLAVTLGVGDLLEGCFPAEDEESEEPETDCTEPRCGSDFLVSLEELSTLEDPPPVMLRRKFLMLFT